jgi:outer membrane protein OmpA-like peptidoglycan-associated protein
MVKRDKKLSLFFYSDIYNKLYSMIKQTWEISNEERNRILSLHESATKNHYLMSEQLETGISQPVSAEDNSEPFWEILGYKVFQRGSDYFLYRHKGLRKQGQEYYSTMAFMANDPKRAGIVDWKKNSPVDTPDTYIQIPTLEQLGGIIKKGSSGNYIIPNKLTQNAIFIGEMMDDTSDPGHSPRYRSMSPTVPYWYCAFNTEKNVPQWGQISFNGDVGSSEILSVDFEKVKNKPGNEIFYNQSYVPGAFIVEISPLEYGYPGRESEPEEIPPIETPKITSFDIESPFEFDKTDLTPEAEKSFKEFIENIKKFYSNVSGDVTVTTSASIDSDPATKEQYNMELSKRRAQTIIDRLKRETGNKTLNFIPNPIGQTDQFAKGMKYPEVRDTNKTAPNRRLIIKLPEISQ